MGIFTKQQFETLAREKSGKLGLRGSINESRMYYDKKKATTSVFLSRSHRDDKVLEQAKIFFESLGVSVYVDWAEVTMAQKIEERTGQRIKDRIITMNDKFVWLATNTAIESRWGNWELGIADAFKLSRDKMVILPLEDSSGTWKGNEYLNIYPRIEQTTNSQYTVCYPNGEKVNLAKWLER